MNTPEGAIGSGASVAQTAERFAPRCARRLLVIGGIGLILCGMILGDIFAAFILHPNANRIGENLLAATQAVAAHNPRAAGAAFQSIGGLLENRGTKVDAHSHMIGFGYIALLVALLQPYVAFSGSVKKSLTKLFLFGGDIAACGSFSHSLRWIGPEARLRRLDGPVCLVILEDFWFGSFVSANWRALQNTFACEGRRAGLTSFLATAVGRLEFCLAVERYWFLSVFFTGAITPARIFSVMKLETASCFRR